MPEIIGREIEFGWGVEDDRGTPQGTAEKWIKKVLATVIEKSEKVTDPSTRNRLEDSCGSRVVRKWIEGDLNSNLHIDPIGYEFYNLYGTVVDNDEGGGVYSHVFTLLQDIQHPSLTGFAKDGAVQQLVYSNCMIATMNIVAVQDDYVKVERTIMGKAATDNSDTPTYSAGESDFVGRHVTVKIADTEGALGAATAIELREANITLDSGIKPNHVLGAYEPEDLYNSHMSIEGTLTALLNDETFKDLNLDDTAKYMEIKIVDTATDIGGGENPELKIVLHKVNIMDWSRSDESDELTLETINFKAFLNETDVKQSEVTLVNNVSEYDEPISA